MSDVFSWLFADYHIHNAKLQVQNLLATINHVRRRFFVLIEKMQDNDESKTLIFKNIFSSITS